MITHYTEGMGYHTEVCYFQSFKFHKAAERSMQGVLLQIQHHVTQWKTIDICITCRSSTNIKDANCYTFGLGVYV